MRLPRIVRGTWTIVGTLMISLTLTACDGPGTTVNPASKLTISGSPASSDPVGQMYSFTPTASGGSGAALSFSISNPPVWAQFNTATGQLSGAPSSSNVGAFSNIVISVTDGTSSASLPALTITVSAAGSPPPPVTISGTPPPSVVAGHLYSFTPTTTYASGKTPTFSISNGPSWATLSASTGQLSGTPAASNVGTYPNIVISVTDGTSSASAP